VWIVVRRVPVVAQRLHSNSSRRPHTPYVPSFVRQLATQKFVFGGLGVIVLRTLPFFYWSSSEIGFPKGFPERIGHYSGVCAGEGPRVAGTARPRDRRSTVRRNDARGTLPPGGGVTRVSSRDDGAGEEG